MMVKTWVRALACAVTCLMPLGDALAQKGPDPLESRLAARKVVMVDGRESLVDAGSAKPGDVIEYTATYRNAGKEPITGLQATLPIPAQTELLPGTAKPAQAMASLDTRTFAAMPLKRVIERGGVKIEEPVPYREYRALRWSAGVLGSGKSADFVARVRVIEDRTPGETAGKGGGK